MFSLELNLTRNNPGDLFVLHENKRYRVTDYQLKLSDFDDNEKKRILRDPRCYSHEFLFDVHFKKGLIHSPPGK
jgi:hypothetical protein